MAKIILNVELGQEKVLNDLKTLESGIKNIASSLGNVKVNKDLTAQLNALTKNYNALSKAAQSAQKVNNNQEISTQKLAKATAQATTAKINEQKASIQLEAAQIKLTKAQQQGVKIVKEATQANEKHKQSILSMAAGFFQWQMAAMFVMKPLNAIRDAWASINETLVKTEDAVVALQRVLNDDSLSDETISGKLYDLAAKYGQTFENANLIAQNFARTGMNWDETIKATETALLALNVAELDATQASDGMIAIMQQFGYEASNLTDIIDILNKTADNYAVTTDKLLTALQRTGSSAKNANLSLQETVGIVTALSEATGRSGENLGTAVNSLIQFSTKSSALDTFAKLSDNMATLVEDFRHGKGTVLDIWKGLSAEIQNSKGSSESILSGLFGDDDWRSLNEELQKALGDNFAKVTEIYDTASTFRKNYFIALLNNMDTVEKAIGTASDAAGYSQKENEKYLDTYTAKLNKLKAKWEEIANDEKGLLGIKKALADIGYGLLWFIEKIGGLKTIVLALGTTVWLLFGKKLTAQIKTLGKNLKEMFAEAKKGAISLNSALGLIGLIATAISLVKGVVDSIIEGINKDTTREDIDKAVDNLDKLSETFDKIDENAKKTRSKLQEVNKILTDENSTTEQITTAKNDLLAIQNDLIDNNAKYKDSIDLINSSYEEQIALINKVSEQEKQDAVKEWLKENESGINASEGYLNKSFTGWTFDKAYYNGWYGSDFDTWLKSKGYSTYATHYGDVGVGDFFGNLFGQEVDNVNIKLDGKSREEVLEILNELYKQAISEGNKEFAEYISYEIASINNDETYANANKIINGDKTSSNWIERLTQKQRQQFANGELSWGDVKEILGIIDDVVDTTKSWAEQSKQVVKNYEDILDIINETRNAQQAIVDLEEKKKALEDARNNRNVRVFNASTGEWELQADQSAIAKAEKDLEDATWTVLENEIKEGNMTAGDIYEKVKEIAVDLPNLAKTIRDAFVAQGYKMPEYDSGGVLRGLGGIKATSQDEIVLPPHITKQILQPSSNAEFAAFAKSLGLLFGSSKQVADMRSGMVVNGGGNSSTDNRSYIANGVPFSKEVAETHTLAELFEMAANYES